MTRPFNLQDLQREAAKWQTRNFGKAQAYQPLLGAMEELGELAHAHLKGEQGIRRGENHHEKKIDAVGDIIIYLTHYCTLEGISLQDAVYGTWNDVKQRDWKRFPVNGATE